MSTAIATAVLWSAAGLAPPPERPAFEYIGVPVRISSLDTPDPAVDVWIKRRLFNTLRSQAGIPAVCDGEGMVIFAISGSQASDIGLPPFVNIMIEQLEGEVFSESLDDFVVDEVVLIGLDGACP